jgi:hypothetical protein
MELAAFFFSYSGLGITLIEYELRHFFTFGEHFEGIDQSLVPEPIGMND